MVNLYVRLYFKLIMKYGSPKQPGRHECNYFVMRYMKDIIDDKELTFTSKVYFHVCSIELFELRHFGKII